MSWNYKFVDHTADVAVDVEGESLEDLFIASAVAFKELILEEDNIQAAAEERILLNESSVEMLLVNFLDELNYFVQAKKWIINSVKRIKIIFNKDEYELNAEVAGENLNEKHKIDLEIKAVTFHQLEIKKTDDKYATRIVFDI